MRRPPGRLSRNRAEVIEALASKFEIDPDTECWRWTEGLTPQGYARFSWKRTDGVLFSAGHRVVMAALGFPLPRGMVIDHLCRVRECINPDHLEVVTSRENVMRSPITLATINSSKTHCPQGHAYDDKNTTVVRHTTRSAIGRVCRACMRDRYAATKAVSA